MNNQTETENKYLAAQRAAIREAGLEYPPHPDLERTPRKAETLLPNHGQLHERRNKIMRKQEINIYTFEELPEKTRDKVLDKLREWNVDCDWWYSVYEDARNIGLDIDSFDIDNHTITGKFITTPDDTANKIIAEHDKACATYKTAAGFCPALTANSADDNAYDDAVDNFRRALLKDYLAQLSKKYDYLTDDKTLLEQIKEGEYEYYEDGRQFMGA